MKVSGIPVSTIIEKHSISISNVYVSISQTLRGNHWLSSSSSGGEPPYLSDVDTQLFKNEIEKRSI